MKLAWGGAISRCFDCYKRKGDSGQIQNFLICNKNMATKTNKNNTKFNIMHVDSFK